MLFETLFHFVLSSTYDFETWNSLEDKWLASTDKKEKKIENKNLVRLKTGRHPFQFRNVHYSSKDISCNFYIVLRSIFYLEFNYFS